MNPTFQAIHSIGNYLKINNYIQKLHTTYLSQDESSGVTTMHADNTTDFASAGILLVSVGDSENAEFINYSAKSSVSSFTVTATTLSHSRGESVSEVSWNQFIIESSPDQVTWSSVATIAIDPTTTFSTYSHLAGTSGLYYRIAFRNSVTTSQSGWSSIIQAVQPAYNSGQQIINEVITEAGINQDDTIITQDFLFNSLLEARRLFDNLTYGYHWDWREVFNQPYKILAGTNFIAMPEDIDFSETNRSLLAVRINGWNQGVNFYLNYVDKKRWNDITLLQQGSYLAQDANIGDTSITVVNAGDFQVGGGSFYIATTDYDQTIVAASYTSVDQVTNVISGINVSAIDRFIPAGTQIWSRTVGTVMPMNYTVFNNKIYFDQVIPNMMQARNVYLDYYKILPVLSNPAEVMPEHHSAIYKYYMKYAIKKRKDDTTPTTDPDFVTFTELSKAIKANMYSGQTLTVRTS